MVTKRVTKINEALGSLNKEDTYSLLLFILYKLKQNPDYLALTELAYILDGDNLSKLLSYFGGLTIKIPTLKELRLVVQALNLYQLVNLEKASFDDALRGLSGDEFSKDELKEAYVKVMEAVQNYEFHRDQPDD